ncbi:hypothetical protein [Natrinema altunense]|uniref:Uncharacterized protein n=1 Tax=Natrinema altunense TaxID=222984 RepID=A0A482XTQ3_9EURY|nr:hypothetical protein [Natrinema altunense]RZH66308.1 hypothetical protein ELS17_18280 [Natrinema altunense]
MDSFLIYGAYGYTGRLIAREAVAVGLFAVTYPFAGLAVDDPTNRAAIAFGVTCLGSWSLS